MNMNNRKNDEKNNFLLEFNEINISQCIFIISMPTQILEWIHGIDSWIHKFIVWIHATGEKREERREIRLNQWMLDVECYMHENVFYVVMRLSLKSQTKHVLVESSMNKCLWIIKAIIAIVINHMA